MTNSVNKDKLKGGELDLSKSGLTEVPKYVAGYKQLKVLNLSRNKISSISQVATLNQLYKLDVSNNMLKDLPENIGNMTNLRYLYLANNQITKLPHSMGKLKNLKYLDLKNNNLDRQYYEKVGPCKNSIQCEYAAQNVVKAFSMGSVNCVEDLIEKSQNTEQKLKKKNNKKNRNDGVNNTKNKKKAKSSKRTIIQRMMYNLKKGTKLVLLSVLLVALLFLVGFYALSLWDQPRYYQVKSFVYPYCHLALTKVVHNEQQALAIEANLVEAGNAVNRTVVAVSMTLVSKSINLYEYVTTDKTILTWVNYIKTKIFDFYDTLRKHTS